MIYIALMGYILCLWLSSCGPGSDATAAHVTRSGTSPPSIQDTSPRCRRSAHPWQTNSLLISEVDGMVFNSVFAHQTKPELVFSALAGQALTVREDYQPADPTRRRTSANSPRPSQSSTLPATTALLAASLERNPAPVEFAYHGYLEQSNLSARLDLCAVRSDLHSRCQRKLVVGVDLDDRVVHIDAQRQRFASLTDDRPDSELSHLGHGPDWMFHVLISYQQDQRGARLVSQCSRIELLFRLTVSCSDAGLYTISCSHRGLSQSQRKP